MRATLTTTPVADIHAAYNKSKLFLISVIALVTAGVSFSMRASVASTLRMTFFDPINPAHSAEMIGAVLGVGSLGFALTIAIGSPMLDFLGMGRLLSLSSLCFIIGTLVVDFADKLGSGDSIYWVLWSGVLLMGVGWGLVETVINPLTAALYTSDKTARLNTLHAWWPGGLIIGGLTGLALDGPTITIFGVEVHLPPASCPCSPPTCGDVRSHLRGGVVTIVLAVHGASAAMTIGAGR